ncbi:hypothetical protein LTR36_010166 [Oleoguttula mirabilis]|uniref:Uncharacterized protein n=1 Tax=Oleoguttula mirabilis TaxID=1507867 RepID=A0AAV9JRN2_9PEZI|nr:hypothetical protein LTR36_010166 [Oleoguttula mirabilis]
MSPRTRLPSPQIPVAENHDRERNSRKVQVTHTDHGGRMSAFWHTTDITSAAPLPNSQPSLHTQTSHDTLGSRFKSSFGSSRLKLAGSDGSRQSIRHGRTKLQPRHEQSPTIRVPNTPHKPSRLRHAYPTDGVDDRNSDPFVSAPSSKAVGKPLSPGAAVTPWDYQRRNGDFDFGTVNSFLKVTKDEAVRDFINRYPPPPEPQSPTRTAGRTLRSTKSDSSIRSAVTIAPSTTSKRSVETVNPDSSPLTYISKVANSPALPSSPADPQWNAAIEYVKRQLAADTEREAREARDETVKRKASPKQVKDIQRQERIKAAEGLIVRSSVFGWAPTKDYSQMTTDELEAYGLVVQEEIAKTDPAKGIKKLFKQVGAQKAKHDILKREYLHGQMSRVDCAKAAKHAEADGQDEEAGMHINDALRMLEFDGFEDAVEQVENAVFAPGEMASTPEKERNAIMRGVFNRSPDHETLYGTPEDERKRTLLALSAVSPISIVRQPVGLNISSMDGAASTRDFGATARLTMRHDSQLSPSRFVSMDDHDGASVYSQNPDGSLVSPLEQDPLTVSRSLLHLEQSESHSAFIPRRDSAFIRKITEASKKRALKLKGSHPALREDTVAPETRPASPFMTYLPLTISERRLREAQYQWKRDSILRGDGPDEDKRHDSFDSSDGSDEQQTMSWRKRRRSPPKLTVDTNVLFPDDEGYHTAPLNQQRLSVTQVLLRQHLSPKFQTPEDFRQVMGGLDVLMHDLHRAGYDGSDADGDRTVNPEDNRQNDDTEVKEITDDTIADPVINIDIDDVIAQWNRSPRRSKNGSASWGTANIIQREEDMQALRSRVGLPPLKLRRSASLLKHPSHPFAWNTEKIMCSLVHSPVSVASEFPSMPNSPTGTSMDMSRVGPRFFAPSADPTSPPQSLTMKLPRCEECLNHCCLYAELLLKAAVKTRGAAEEHFRLQAEEKVENLRRFYPNGIEGISTFLTCMECSRMVCPNCATVCDECLCRQVMCKEHCTDGRCSYHQYV